MARIYLAQGELIATLFLSIIVLLLSSFSLLLSTGGRRRLRSGIALAVTGGRCSLS